MSTNEESGALSDPSMVLVVSKESSNAGQSSQIDGKLRDEHVMLRKYAKENVFPVPAFRALRAEADRLLPSGASPLSGPPGKYQNCFSDALQNEFLSLCESHPPPDGATAFGITYVQEQLGLAVAITEKRLKGRSQKAASLGERSSANARLKDFREVLPLESMIEGDPGAYTVSP